MQRRLTGKDKVTKRGPDRGEKIEPGACNGGNPLEKREEEKKKKNWLRLEGGRNDKKKNQKKT